MSQKGFKNSILFIIIAVIIAVGGYFLFSQKSLISTGTQTEQATQQLDTSDWKTYRNEELGFEFKYPQNFLVGKFKPEPIPSGNVPSDIEEKLEDIGWNNATVLIELEQKALFSGSPKDFSVDSIPVGEIPFISIKPITTSADFFRSSYIDSKVYNGSQVKIGEYTVTKLPGYPGPYGDGMYYYLLPISDNLIIEFVGFKEKILTDTTKTESHYDKVIEDIISTVQFLQ